MAVAALCGGGKTPRTAILYLKIYGRENYYLVYFRLPVSRCWPLNMLARNTFLDFDCIRPSPRRFYYESGYIRHGDRDRQREKERDIESGVGLI